MSAVDVRSLIVAEAQSQGVDPGIAIAVATRESKLTQWYPDGSPVRGSSGEIGIFQLMPATAAALGVDPSDIYQNIRGGVSYLAQMFAEFGNWPDALAAYNCGPGCVQKYKAGQRNLPASTISYVNQVLPNAQIQSAAVRMNIAASSPDPSTSAESSQPDTTPTASPGIVPAVLLAGAALGIIWAFGD